ncbi:DJ-1/PfpI family protein [Horticoccus luteus]|uniref:DJ-1/PfpI family protein n=1 Tax=Horticoccus luteus TaxID=2862869 RepID=A0A8F9TV63_9BACT|nr:DJ-1/PfpI family protein [Horticoccus luteus]QYM78363.1 DJ-1/PfpI family protein [Horticoccus luteus]
MNSLNSHSPWSSQRSARAVANECLTTYPPQWTPAMLRASGTKVFFAPRTTAPILPFLGRAFLLGVALLGIAQAAFAEQPSLDAATQPSTVDAPLPVYRARFERTRPVIAIVGENSGTELSDFAIPYGVLVRAGVAEVITVATQPGVLHMRPALQVQPDASIAEFDARFPQGADYVIVPAVVKFNDPTLLAWVKAQGTKGGMVVSICDGAAVVAGTGLMDGHRATAHWASAKNRRRLFPSVKWIDNIRYVADRQIISTAGISAALPTSIALVEAIAGRERAASLARELGVSDWGTAHDTAQFRPRLGVNLRALIAVTYTNGWFRSTEMIGLPIADGVDEIALAVTADGYSRTGRSLLHALSASSAPVRSRSGLMIVPDTRTDGRPMDRELPPLEAYPSAESFVKTIDGIHRLYGRTTAYGVALNFEYPLIPKRSLANEALAQ